MRRPTAPRASPASCSSSSLSAAWTTSPIRLGFAISRRQARQVVRHGHVQVNGRKVNIPSYQVSVGDEIAVREGARKLVVVEQGVQYAAQNPVPTWLEVNFENMSGRVLHLPKRADVNLPINEQLIVELYSK